MGCGTGWTTLFLAEAGIDALGLDLVPANVEVARERAQRWGSSARFEVADMDALPDGPPVDVALVFDALHHTHAQRAALASIFRRVKPGGWIVLAEPTWLHRLSPEARRVRRERGWLERGLTLRGLGATCAPQASARPGGSSSPRAPTRRACAASPGS